MCSIETQMLDSCNVDSWTDIHLAPEHVLSDAPDSWKVMHGLALLDVMISYYTGTLGLSCPHSYIKFSFEPSRGQKG